MEYTAVPKQHPDFSGLLRDEAKLKLQSFITELSKKITSLYPSITLQSTSFLGLVYLDIPEDISIQEIETNCECTLFKSEILDNLITLIPYNLS